jgi:predicted DNA-binding transcriptional regulator AlpA
MNSKNLLRFADLRARGIVRNWPQLRRLVEAAGFPRGWMLTRNARVWDEADVDAWLDARRRAHTEAA